MPEDGGQGKAFDSVRFNRNFSMLRLGPAFTQWLIYSPHLHLQSDKFPPTVGMWYVNQVGVVEDLAQLRHNTQWLMVRANTPHCFLFVPISFLSVDGPD